MKRAYTRNRVLAGAIKRANENRSERDLAPLPEGLTPHSLRRAYISLALASGEDVPYVMRGANGVRGQDSPSHGWMGDPGLEPGTSSLSERRSNRLS